MGLEIKKNFFSRRALLLYPLAGLSTADAAKLAELEAAKSDLALSKITIAREFLDGRIDEAEAVRLSEKYGLVSPESAKKSIDFAKQYRSYVLNYGYGEQLVRADIEAAGATPASRWARMQAI